MVTERYDGEDRRPSGEGDSPDERPPLTGLRLYHVTQVSLEKFRIQTGNRLSALERHADELDDPAAEAYRELFEVLDGFEARFEDLMLAEAKKYPVYDYWLKHVKGIGPALAGQLLAMLLPPLVERGPSTWYKAAGLTVEEHDGQSRLPRARAGGGKLTYYPRLRRTLYNLATSFVRAGPGYYPDEYEKRKARLVAKHEGDANWPPHRLDAVARWSTVKLFLSHLYEKWLEAEGETGRKAYVLEVLGHTTYIAPPEPVAGRKV